MCDHPKLHTLNLSGQYLHKQLTREGWISFARKRKEQEQNNNGRIKSMILNCCNCDDVMDEVLEAFAGVKRLETLRVACNRDITDEGINKFGSIRSNISINYTKIKLYSCYNVSFDNPHAVFVQSPF